MPLGLAALLVAVGALGHAIISDLMARRHAKAVPELFGRRDEEGRAEMVAFLRKTVAEDFANLPPELIAAARDGLDDLMEEAKRNAES